MGQQVNRSSKVKSPSESDWTTSLKIKNLRIIIYLNKKLNYTLTLLFILKIKLILSYNFLDIVMDKLLLLDPKPGDLSKTRL
jgi:hypothetical protein